MARTDGEGVERECLISIRWLLAQKVMGPGFVMTLLTIIGARGIGGRCCHGFGKFIILILLPHEFFSQVVTYVQSLRRPYQQARSIAPC